MDIFSNTGPHKVPYALSRSQYGTIVAWHISRRYSVSGQVLANISLVTDSAALTILSCNWFTFCTFSRWTVSFTNLQTKKKSGGVFGEREGKGMGPVFQFTGQETPSPGRHESSRKSEVVHRLTGRLFPQGHNESSVLHYRKKKVSPVAVGSAKRKDRCLCFPLKRTTQWPSVNNAYVLEMFHQKKKKSLSRPITMRMHLGYLKQSESKLVELPH